MRRSNEVLREKTRESVASVLPITIIVLVLCFILVPTPNGLLLSFLVGAAMLILGMGLFTLGADMSMTLIGEHVGSSMTKSRKIFWIICGSFFIGVIITISEPDLQVLAQQVTSIPNFILIMSVSLGVGIFLVVAMLRVLLKIKLRYLLIFFYLIVFVLAAFVPKEFLSIAFDSGGVTTGPMTVPFIMALGVGVCSVRNDEGADDDSFGMVALCSIGPILAVLILGLLYSPGITVDPFEIPALEDSRQLWDGYLHGLPEYVGEVALSLAPIALFFIIFQLVSLKLPRKQFIKICVGILYTYFGLVLFLTGVNVGFMPVGYYLGSELAQADINWLIIPLAMLIGYFIVAAEPAVHVLNKQVNDITNGAVSAKAMNLSLSIGVAVSLGLSMIRVMTGLSIMWFIVPGYLIALVLSFIVPEFFTSIAFDSGGVASGPMTATFLLPFAQGASNALGGNIIMDAFGVVAMVAMTPLITIQVLGLYYTLKQKRVKKVEETDSDTFDDEIIELK